MFPLEGGIYFQPAFAYSYTGESRYMFTLGITKITKIDGRGGQGGGGAVLDIFSSEKTWSIGALGLLKDGKFYPGIKVGADYQFMVFIARIEGGFTTANIFLNPQVGLRIGPRVNLFGGYHVVLVERSLSGFIAGITVTTFKL